MKPNSLTLKFFSVLILVTFTTQQISWGQDLPLNNISSPQSTRSIEEAREPVTPAPEPKDPLFQSNTIDFLQNASPLTAVEPLTPSSPLSAKGEDYEYERYEFEDALELLRPEFASAVIVKNFTKDNLEKLVRLDIEVSIVILHGEIVLFSSGSQDEVGVLPAVKDLIGKASFISHTHPNSYSKEGPSGQDLNNAVAAPLQEYVITQKGVYAYNRASDLGKEIAPMSFDDYFAKLNQALDASLEGRNQVGARKDLNDFIAEQDRYNQALEEEKTALRMGGTLSYNSSYNVSKVTSFVEKPRPYLTGASSVGTTLSYYSSTSQFALNYSVPASGDQSGFDISFDNASTSQIETMNLSTYGTTLVFGLRGSVPSVQLEVEDARGTKDTLILTNISATIERFWAVPLAAISATLDTTRIKSIKFIITQANITSTVKTGTLFIRTKNLNTVAPTVPILVPPPKYTNQTTVTLSGTKEAYSAVFINNVQVTPRDPATTWSARVSLPAEKSNTFYVKAKNSLGSLSPTSSFTIYRDTSIPTGTININSGAAYALSSTVTLNLSAVDISSGVSQMSFSTDNINWTTPETYTRSRTFILPSGDGPKTIYVKFIDLGGNVSSIYSKSIILDTQAPSGSILINNGNPFTNQTSALLNLQGIDAGAGVDQMTFSQNGISWGPIEVYNVTKSWVLSAGDGTKTVYVKFRDKAGKWSNIISAAILLDTVVPTGNLNINSGATYSTSPTVPLNLSGADTGSGIDRMSFSTDNVNWTAAEAYASSKSYVLPSGDGSKTVYVKYLDKAGNISPVYSKTITLDTRPPQVQLTSAIPTFINTSTLQVSYVVDGAAKQTIFNLAEGLNNLSIVETDPAGNRTMVPLTVIRDTTLPTGSLSIHPETTWVTSTDATHVGQSLATVNWADIQTGDINGDGRTDVIGRATDNQWYGALSNQSGPSTIKQLTKGWSFVTDVKIADINSDGLQDFIGRATSNNQWYAALSNLGGVFSTVQLTSGWDLITETQMADINGDGRPDLVGRATSNNQWYAALSNINAPSTTLPLTVGWSLIKDTGFFDINSDGRADLVGRASTGEWCAAIPNADGTVTSRILVQWTESVGWKDVRFIDTNGDGRLDIIGRATAPANAGQWWTSFIGANGTITGTKMLTQWTESVGWKDINFSDINGDGQLDIVGRATIGGSAGEWWTSLLGPGGTILGTKMIVKWNEAALWQNVHVADLNGDGRADILGRATASSNLNQWWTSLMGKDATVARTKLLGGWSTSANWSGFSLGDSNGDSLPDVLGCSDTLGCWSAVFQLQEPAAPNQTNSQKVTLSINAADSSSGLKEMRYSLDNGVTWQPWQIFKRILSLNLSAGDGQKKILFQLKDRAGNLTSLEDTILLDTVSPIASFSINEGATFTHDRLVDISYNVIDQGSGFGGLRFSVNGGVDWTAWQSYLDTIPVLNPDGSIVPPAFYCRSLELPAGDGGKNVSLQFKDQAGNFTTLHQSIFLDTTAPSGYFLINRGSVTTADPNVEIFCNLADASSGVDTVRFSGDGGITWTTWEAYEERYPVILPNGTVIPPEPYRVQLSGADGTKQVLMQSQDKVGNIATFAQTIMLERSTNLIFISPTVTDTADYQLRYTINGVEKSEHWRLRPGMNELMVKVATASGQVIYGHLNVTLTAAEPILPTMPEILPLPSDIISVTTQEGLVLEYHQSALVAIEKAGEYELFSPELDAAGNLTGGIIRFDSGDKVLFRDSKALLKLSENGEKTFYDEAGAVISVVTNDGKEIRFARRLDESGNTTAILALETAATSLYEGEKPVWISMQDGTEIRYRDGLLAFYRDAAGNQFNYEITDINLGSVRTGYKSELVSVVPSGGFSALPISQILQNISQYPAIQTTLNEKLARIIEYDANGRMKKAVSGKGEVLELENLLPKSLLASSGDLKLITSEFSSQEALNAMNIASGSLTQTFDADGKLSEIHLNDGTVLHVTDAKLDKILLADGSILTGLKWNGSNLTDFMRKKSDGTEETYVNSHITSRKEANGNITTYLVINGKDTPDQLTTADGRVYHFITYQNANGQTERVTELIQINLSDGSRIELEHGKPVRYIQKKTVQLDPYEVPLLPQGQSYIPSLKFSNAELRSVTIDASANILTGEILFNDGTQYILKDGKLIKQITPDGQIIEISEASSTTFEKPVPIGPEPLTQDETAYRNQLLETQLNFFVPGVGIEAESGMPLDNFQGATNQASTYSQATLVGFWAEILSAVARGDYATGKMSQAQAFQKLNFLLSEFIKVQQQAGWNGMVAFFTITKEERPILDALGNPTGLTEWVRVYKPCFNTIGIGDNLNLSLSLASVIGALSDLALSGELATARDQIIASANQILTAQDAGYAQFFDNSTKRFRMARIISGTGTGTFTGYMDRVFNEFRTGLIWLAARNATYKPAVENLDAAVRSYTASDGTQFDNAVPFDGGAFQMFWPLIHVDETKYPEFNVAIKNFLYAQADFVNAKGLPGLLSAGDDPTHGYKGKVGLPSAAETDDPLLTDTGSLYGTAGAFLAAPHYTLQFLKNIETQFSQAKTTFGFRDAIAMRDVTRTDPQTGLPVTVKEPVYSNQYFGVDQASFILSFLGTSQGYFTNYLNSKGLATSFDSLYRGMSFDLTPVTNPIVPPPAFGSTLPPLYQVANSAPDGRLNELVKRPSFIASIKDPEFGEGRLFDYLNADGKLHHIEIEFGSGASSRTLRLQEYLLLAGRGDAARSILEGFSLDLLNEASGQGAFYTPGSGYANSFLVTDPRVGEVHRVTFDLKTLTKPVGIWAQYQPNKDLSQFDYLSVPARLLPGAPAGTRLKFELKGLGEIYVTEPLTNEWQYFDIPIVKPAGLLREIAVVVQSPTGQAIKGELEIGSLSAFKVRTSNTINWLTLVGKTDTEMRVLLKEKVLTQPGGGGLIEADEVLENFILDHDGKLISGVLKRADGGIQYFRDSKLVKWVFRNGRTVLFEEGLATFALDLARGKLEEARYYYDKTFRGEIRSFVLQDNDRKRVYNSKGELELLVEGGNFVHFKEGVIDSIETPGGTLTNFTWGDDQSLLRAHVTTLDGREFDIDQAGQQMILRPNGVKVYYQGSRIVGIETPQNGRTDFTYNLNTLGQILGVTAIFPETIQDPVTGLPSVITRTMSLFDYLSRPERSLEKTELLREAPFQVLPIASVGGFNMNSGGHVAGGKNYSTGEAWLSFQYNQPSGSPFGGLYVQNPQSQVNLTNYDFVQIKIKQDPSMTWNQDFYLKLKLLGVQTLYTFSADNTTNDYKTYAFSLAGKSGTETEITLEPIQEAAGVNKAGYVTIKEISYLSLKKLDSALWETELGVRACELQSIRIESAALSAVGSEIASGKPLLYSQLIPMLDMPTWLDYAAADQTGSESLSGFKRFDGSTVELEGTNVKRLTLADGTVNEYAAGTNSLTAVAQSFDDPTQAGTLNYQYGSLRKITQSDGREFELSYEFDSEGNQITVLRDPRTAYERRFKDGKLLSSTTENQLKTNYVYEEGELAAAEMVYKNKILNSASYIFNDDETQITDERGTTWYYDADGDLTKHLTKDGYLYQYSDYSFSGVPETLAADDFKRAIFSSTDLRAVTFTGYENTEGSQLILGSGGIGEIKFIGGDHGVNLEFDNNRRIKNGQVQFADGTIIEIENYLPVRGRDADGNLFSIPYPAGIETEIVQGEGGVYQGFKFKQGEKLYTYDAKGFLTEAASSSGETDTFTYPVDANGNIPTYTRINKKQITFRGVPYPKEVRLTGGTKQTLHDAGKNIAEHDGEGFLVGFFNDSINQWDVYSGRLASAADRLALENFLKEIKPGQAVAAMISDSAFSQAGETILGLLEGLGAGNIRTAASANKSWAFFGNESLNLGEGYEASDVTVFSTVTETVTTAAFSSTNPPTFDGYTLSIPMPPAIRAAYSRFLENYERLKPSAELEVISVFNRAGEQVFSRRIDGTTAYYEHGKLRETYNAGGELLYIHEYACPMGGCQTSDDYFLAKVTIVKSRLDFEREARKMREQIEQTKFDALYRLAWQDEVARLRIQEEVNAGLKSIDKQIASLEAQRYQTVTQCQRGGFFGCQEECRTETVEVPGVAEAINNMRRQRADLIKTGQDELAKIPGEVAAKKQEIETMTALRMSELDQKEEEFYLDLLREEMTPVLTEFYRRILGRDPSSEERDTMVERFKTTERIDTAVLYQELSASSEKAQREADKAAITEGVRTFLQDYLNASSEARITLLQGLTLNSSEVIALEEADVTAILAWLESRDLHFGQSAFLSLKNMLASRGVEVPMVTLGIQSLLVDILTGTINRFTEGDLLLSVFALNRTAEIHGQSFVGVQYTYEDLAALYASVCPDPNAPCSLRLIAHIGEDHFVVLTRVTATEVSYLETSKGASGEEFTVTKAQFLNAWQVGEQGGYLIVPEAVAIQAKKLTDQKTQEIRGSFFFFFFFFFMAVSFVLSVASIVVSFFSPTAGKILGYAAMVAGIIGIVTAIANWVVSGVQMAFSAIASGNLLGTIGQGLMSAGKFLMEPVTFVGRFLQQGFVFLKDTFTTGFQSLGMAKIFSLKEFLTPVLTLSAGPELTFGQQLVRGLITSVVSAQVTQGLSDLGLNPIFARLASSFVGAGMTGIGGTGAEFFMTGLKHLMIQGVSEIGLKLSLPPPITSAISTIANSSISAWFSPALSLKDALTAIAPQVTSQLAFGGVELLGRSLGLDPRIAALIGLPISAVIGGTVAGILHPTLSNTAIFNYMKQSLLSGAVSIGSSIALDAIGAPPVLQASLPSLLGSLVLSSGFGGGSSTTNPSDVGKNIFAQIYENVQKFGSGVISAASHIISFGAKVIEGIGSVTKAGFAKAIDFFSGMFENKTREALLAVGNGSIESAILQNDFVNLGNDLYRSTIHFAGEDIQLEWDAQLDEWSVIQGSYQQRAIGLRLVDDYYLPATLIIRKSIGDNFVITENYEAGNMTKALIEDKNGKELMKIEAFDRSHPIEFNHEGNLIQFNTTINRELQLTAVNGYLRTIAPMRVIDDNNLVSAIEQVQYFSQIYHRLADNPQTNSKTTIYKTTNGVAIADMKLDWLIDGLKMDKMGILTADILFLLIKANQWWAGAVENAVPKIVDQIRDSTNKFIFTPGIYSGIRTDISSDGYALSQIDTLASIFQNDRHRVMFAHSAGTEAQLKAILAAKEAGIDLSKFKFVFASPRVTRATFVKYLEQAGVKPEQVLVVTAAGDLPHWPTDLITSGGVLGTSYSSCYDYENSGGKYNYLYLSEDLTANQNGTDALLEHGGMIDGVFANHRYKILENGVWKEDALQGLYSDFVSK